MKLLLMGIIPNNTSTSKGPREIVFRKEHIIIPILVSSAPMTGLMIDQNPVVTHNNLVDQVVQETPDIDVDHGDAPLKGHKGLTDLQFLLTILFTCRSMILILVIPHIHLPTKKPSLVLNPFFRWML